MNPVDEYANVGRPQRIVIARYPPGKCWVALCQNIPGQPEHELIPLPYTLSAFALEVIIDMERRYPTADVRIYFQP
jgi:hypothetical protein